MFSLRTKLLFLLVPITLALLAGLGYFNYLKSAEMLDGSARNYLKSIVDSKQAEMADYIDSTEKIGAALAATDTVQTYVELTNRNLGGRNKETLEQLAYKVENLLYTVQEAHWGRYRHIFVINQSNRVVVSPSHGSREKGVSSELLGQDMSRNRWAMGALQSGKIALSDYAILQESDHAGQMLFYPVRDVANRVQAVIGFELQVAHQQRILTRGLGFGETARVYLTTTRGVPIVQKGLDAQAPLTAEIVAEATLNGSASARRLNPKGHEVIGLYAKNKKTPWIVVAEIETAEVFEDLHFLQKILVGGLAATVVILLLLALLFANSVVKPLRDTISQVERISLGEFNIEIPDTRRRDEIGTLTETLQRLVFSLQLVSKKLRDAKALKTRVMKAKAQKAQAIKKAS